MCKDVLHGKLAIGEYVRDIRALGEGKEVG